MNHYEQYVACYILLSIINLPACIMAVHYYTITQCVSCAFCLCIYASYAIGLDRSKRRKTENQRSNRKKVICLRCDKVLNDDNTKYHQAAKHEGLAPSFRAISERGQTLLNFNKVTGQKPQVNQFFFHINFFLFHIQRQGKFVNHTFLFKLTF